MKRNLQLLLIPALLLAFTACASFQNTAGKLLASTSDTVDADMKGWATYVVINKVPEDKQLSVRNAYANYQNAMLAAEAAYKAAVQSGDQSPWTQASAALTAASGSLIALITQLEGGK